MTLTTFTACIGCFTVGYVLGFFLSQKNETQINISESDIRELVEKMDEIEANERNKETEGEDA